MTPPFLFLFVFILHRLDNMNKFLTQIETYPHRRTECIRIDMTPLWSHSMHLLYSTKPNLSILFWEIIIFFRFFDLLDKNMRIILLLLWILGTALLISTLGVHPVLPLARVFVLCYIVPLTGIFGKVSSYLLYI